MTDRISRSLSLIIPVYAEGSEVYHVLDSHFRYLQDTFNEFEIIIALDGDDEETRNAITEFQKNGENIRIHHSSERRGKGEQFSTLFR